MYFSHKNNHTNFYAIESSALDGSNRRLLINCTKSAVSLTIDFPTNRLYFIYQETGAIIFFDLETKIVSFTPTIELSVIFLSSYF